MVAQHSRNAPEAERGTRAPGLGQKFPRGKASIFSFPTNPPHFNPLAQLQGAVPRASMKRVFYTWKHTTSSGDKSRLLRSPTPPTSRRAHDKRQTSNSTRSNSNVKAHKPLQWKRSQRSRGGMEAQKLFQSRRLSQGHHQHGKDATRKGTACRALQVYIPLCHPTSA